MMKRLRKPAAVAAAASIALCAAAAAQAAAPPSPRCRPASKIEYRSAREQHLLRNRYGQYVRTGQFWRRHYWYCPG